MISGLVLDNARGASIRHADSSARWEVGGGKGKQKMNECNTDGLGPAWFLDPCRSESIVLVLVPLNCQAEAVHKRGLASSLFLISSSLLSFQDLVTCECEVEAL